MLVVTAAQMQGLDRRTIDGLGLPGMVLMEAAGRCAVEAMRLQFGPPTGYRALVVCGKGNNGGDGYVIARHLTHHGANTEIVALAKVDQLQGDALANARICQRLAIPICELAGVADLSALEQLAARSDVIVDAIFGTGLQRPAGGHYAEAIRIMNDSDRPVIAVDIPSGLFADSGSIPGPAVTAALTVTFGLPKIAHVTQPAAERCGKIAVADIGIPPAFAADIAPRTELLDSGCLARLRSARRPGSHKGNYGHLLIVAGSPGKLGAAMLAARAALTMGTGLVTVGLPASLNVAFEASVTEAMSLPLPETADGCLAERAADRIEEFLARVTALALGPGLSTAPESVRVVHRLVANRIRPVVIDADGLNALQAAPELLTPNSAAEPMVLTPHPGEMSRLTGMTTADIQNQRLDCARQFAAQRGAHLVLKGAGTVIAAPDGRAFINPTGNPGMATGGSGDVLTGIIGSLLAQAMPLPEAACAAVYLHGAAADLAVADRPMWNLTAGEIVAHLGQAALRLPTDQPSPWLTFLNG